MADSTSVQNYTYTHSRVCCSMQELQCTQNKFLGTPYQGPLDNLEQRLTVSKQNQNNI